MRGLHRQVQPPLSVACVDLRHFGIDPAVPFLLFLGFPFEPVHSLAKPLDLCSVAAWRAAPILGANCR